MVYGHEKRDDFLRGMLYNRKIFPVFEDKKTSNFNNVGKVLFVIKIPSLN